MLFFFPLSSYLKNHNNSAPNGNVSVKSFTILAIKRHTSTKMKAIYEKVREILMEKLGVKPTEITPDANFMKDLGADSLDYAELVMAFEKTFDIAIPDDEAQRIKTVNEAVNYIKSHQKNKI